MSLVKTEKGRLALQQRDPSLGPKERQVLILANGTRSLRQYKELMGEEALVMIADLIRHGYLLQVAYRAPSPAKLEASLFPAKEIQPVAADRSRRSLAATKMYIMDMLQMMRDMDASAMAAKLQSAAGTEEFFPVLMETLQFIRDRSGAGYAVRIMIRLREVIPVEHLGPLESFLVQCEAEIEPASV
jgi:hypothetical protein